MAIIRVEKTKNYTVMSNQHLRDQALSLSARGLMSMMLSLPDDWDFSIAGLSTLCKEGAQVIRRCLSEMEKAGYLTRKRVNGGGGHFTYEYTLTETPSPCNGQPHTGLPHTVEPHTVNSTQINTDVSNTEIQNTDTRKKESKARTARIDVDGIFARYTTDEKTLALLRDWLDVRKAKRAPRTERALTANLDKLEAVAKESGLDVPAYLEGVIMRGWAAFYPIPKYGGSQQRTGYGNRPQPPVIRPEDYNGDDVPW